MPGWRPLDPGEESCFDEAAGSDPRCGFMQSGFWAEFKRLEGYEVTRLAYTEEEKVVGYASFLRFPMLDQPTLVLCPEGPVLPWEDVESCRRALRALIDVARQMPNTIGLRIEPNLPRPTPKVLLNWADAPTDLVPADTLFIDLRLSKDEILAAAHHKCRYNLGVADRSGVEVTRTQDLAAAHEFYGLLQETAARNDFFIEPFGFFLNLMSILFERNTGELFVSRYQGDVLAAILVVYFGRRATYLYGASGSRHRRVMGSYPLHRAAMEAARTRGCLEYDMYGIDAFARREHLYAGITRFKTHWGGEIQRRIGARDIVFYDRLADRIVEQLSH